MLLRNKAFYNLKKARTAELTPIKLMTEVVNLLRLLMEISY